MHSVREYLTRLYTGGATETSHQALWNEMVEWLMQAFDVATSEVGSCIVPALVVVPNKTLAAQVARELRAYLGESHRVELFVSHFSVYVPESYSNGRYTEKRSAIDSDLDALRHRATRALVEPGKTPVVEQLRVLIKPTALSPLARAPPRRQRSSPLPPRSPRCATRACGCADIDALLHRMVEARQEVARTWQTMFDERLEI